MTLARPGLDSAIERGVRVWRGGGTGRVPVVAVAGPPTSSLLFRHLHEPLRAAGHPLVLPEPFHPPPAHGDVASLVERLREFVDPAGVLVAHGLAVPLGFALAARTGVCGLVVLDGPIDRPGPVVSALAALGRSSSAALAGVLRPTWAIPFLASSIALRRTVINPYAMDRDTVALLSAPVLGTRSHRRRVAEYIVDIGRIRDQSSLDRTDVMALWSASDLLFPLPGDLSRYVTARSLSTKILPLGRFLTVEERPWEVAEHLLAWIHGLDAPTTTTPMSRFGDPGGPPSQDRNRQVLV